MASIEAGKIFNVSEDLSDESKDLIREITPNIEDRLRRHAIETGERFQMYKKQQVNFDDIFVSEKSSELRLTNINMKKYPEFRLSELLLNIEKLYIKVKFELNKLRIESDQETNIKGLPVARNGKMTFDLEDLTLEGIVALSVAEDSFLPQNYHFNFTSARIITNVSDCDEPNKQRSQTSHLTDVDSQTSLLSSFWNDVNNYLIKTIVQRQIGESIINYSYGETLCDEESVMNEYRQYAVGQSTRANLIFDSLLSKVIKRLVNTKELDVEDIYRTQSDRRFTATNGRIGDMSQLIRKRNFNLYETSDTLFLIGKMQFDSFKCVYDEYVLRRVADGTQIQKGNISLELYGETLVKLSISKRSEHTMNLDDLQIDAKYSEMVATNLDHTLEDDVKSCIMGHLKYSILTNVKATLRNAFVETLKNVNVQDLINQE